MSIIGKLDNQGDLPPHFDEKDSITALIHLGKSVEGGATQYYNGDTISNKGSMKAQIPFRYGQIQIGCCNKTLRSVEPWSGKRGCINLNLKIAVLNHFETEGMKYFSQYRNNKYPSKTFYAT